MSNSTGIEIKSGMTVLTGAGIETFKILTLRSALKLELRGLRRRGKSAYALVKEKFGFTGTRQSVYKQLDKWCEENLPLHNEPEVK